MPPEQKPASDSTQASGRIIPADVSSRIDAWWGLFIFVIALILALVIFKPDPYLSILIFVWDGVLVTLWVTVASFVLTLIAGMFGGLGRLSKNPIIFGISSLYVELVRGIPLLVQLIWWYFAFPVVLQGIGRSLGIQALATYKANPIAMSILGLTFCYGAYMSEIYRAGIQSISKGQMEAAMSLGMNYLQAMRYVILPQAIRVILPPVGNEFIALLKDSSLVSAVAVADLTRRGREYMSSTFIPIETWMMVALLYLVLTLFSARVASYIEKRVKVAER
jgi:polar amino acid transport system permease protein